MSRLTHTKNNTIRRKLRIRKTISGTHTRPRLSVHISLRNITAQIIDDDTGRTMAYVSTATVTLPSDVSSMMQKAEWAGKEIAVKSKSAKIKRVVFDRNGKLYHGKIKAFAEAARTEGLEF